MAEEPLHVRDALEASCIARLAGVNPRYIEKVSLDDSVERWSFSSAEGEAWAQDFRLGDGTGELRCLKETQMRDLAYSLVASVPARTDLMGAAYLTEVVLVLAEALGLLESLGDSTDELLALLSKLSLASQIAEPFSLEKLAVPPGKLALSQGQKAELPNIPAAWSAYAPLLLEDWRIVTEDPGRRLLRHQEGALLWLKCEEGGEGVEEARLLEGSDALMAWAVNGFALTPETARDLLSNVQAGGTLSDTIGALKEGVKGHLNVLGSVDAGGNRVLHFILVDEDSTRRRAAVLCLVVGTDQVVLGSQLLQGPPGFDQMMRVLERVSLERSSDPRMRRIAERQALSNEARLVVAPFLSTAGDRQSLTASLRPRPGDAAKVFLPELSTAIEAASNRFWEGEPRIAPESGQTEVSAWVAFREDFETEDAHAKKFAQAYKALTTYMQPNRAWVTWAFHAPGKEKGTRYDGLVWIDDHWAWFPKPWKLIPRH